MASNVENVSIWWRHHDQPQIGSLAVTMQHHCGLVMPYDDTDQVNIRSGLLLDGLMTPSHYLNQYWLDHHRCSLAFTQEQFHQVKCSWTESVTCVQRLHFKNDCHISQWPMSWLHSFNIWHYSNTISVESWIWHVPATYSFNTLRPRQNSCHVADNNSKCIFLNDNEFLLEFHWSLFLGVQSTIFLLWFR